MKLLIHVIQIVCVFCTACTITSCQHKDNREDVAIHTAKQGPFEVIVEIAKKNADAIVLTGKMKYNGDRDIQLRHSDPLISIVVLPMGEEAAHTFDSVERTTLMKPDEILTVSGPTEFKTEQAQSEVSVLAKFDFDDRAYAIPLKFSYGR